MRETAAAQRCHVPASARELGRRAQGGHRRSLHILTPWRAGAAPPRHKGSCTLPLRALSQTGLSSEGLRGLLTTIFQALMNLSPPPTHQPHNVSAYSIVKDHIVIHNGSLPPSPPIYLQAPHYALVQTFQSFRQESNKANPEGARLAHHFV